MTWIKICGITRAVDAEAAIQLGANALGFNFCRSSRRYIEPEAALEIIARLPAQVTKAGIFVNEVDVLVKQITDLCGLDLLQFHGDEPPEYCRNFNMPFLKVFHIADEADLALLHKFLEASPYAENRHLPRILLDTRVDGALGGTGKVFDWSLAVKAKGILRAAVGDVSRLVLSGGLGPDNVQRALDIVAPYGVDVASGVEADAERAPGIKDPQLMRRFMASVHDWDQRQKP